MTVTSKKKSSTKNDDSKTKSDKQSGQSTQAPQQKPVKQDDIVVTEKKEPTDATRPSDLSRVMSVSNTLETATAAPRCNVMIIDNFYNNPMETREFILTQEFNVRGNYPGVRTRSFATEEIKNMLQAYVGPSGGNITQFPMEEATYNGAFQITTSRDRSWVHTDGWKTNRE